MSAPDPPRKKPLVTANQVTFARLALLPLGSWLMYQGPQGRWIALIFMTIVGCTDFVDGWLARKYGPTVLGGLMDPIADKVFVAVTFLPAIDLGWFPWYLVGLIFVREFLVTAARTAYERRKVSLKTSYLAKVKTWFQMCGIGLVFMLRTVERAWVMNLILAVIWIGPVLWGAFWLVWRRKVWRGSVVWLFCWAAFFGTNFFFGAEATTQLTGWSILAITYASGGAYLFGMRELPGTGRIDLNDVVRLFGATALPILATLLIAREGVASWPILVAVSLEFAVGGLDNLLTHHDRMPAWPGWLARVGSQAVLLGAALYLVHRGEHELVMPLELATLAITAASTAVVFYRNRDVYLAGLGDAPLVEKSARNARTEAAP